MVELPAIRRLDGEFAQKLYAVLLCNAPDYLRRCNLHSAMQFALWCVAEQAHWVELDHGGILLTDWRPGLLVRIHPLAWGKKLYCSLEYQQETLSLLFTACRVKRIEAMIPIEAPVSLLKWCEKAGLKYEGTLRSITQWRGSVTDGMMYAMVEV